MWGEAVQCGRPNLALTLTLALALEPALTLVLALALTLPVWEVANWPRIHMAIQALGCVLFTAGFVLAYVGTEEKKAKHFDGTHQCLGLVLLILGWAQILLGVWRPENGNPEPFLHWLWSIKHRVLGVALMIGAAVNIYEGIDLYNPNPSPNRCQYLQRIRPLQDVAGQQRPLHRMARPRCHRFCGRVPLQSMAPQAGAGQGALVLVER